MKSAKDRLAVIQFPLDPVKIHRYRPLLLGDQIPGLQDGCADILDRTRSA